MNGIEKSTGNVYEDLGNEDSNEMRLKAQLAATIKLYKFRALFCLKVMGI